MALCPFLLFAAAKESFEGFWQFGIVSYLPTFKFQKEGQMRKMFKKKRDIPTFSILYYIQIFEKRGTHGKIALFCYKMRDCPSKRGTVGKSIVCSRINLQFCISTFAFASSKLTADILCIIYNSDTEKSRVNFTGTFCLLKEIVFHFKN